MEQVWGVWGPGGRFGLKGSSLGLLRDLDLGCLGALGEETLGIWGVVGSEEGVWTPRGAGLGCLGSEEQGWGPRGAGLGCLGIWGQIWVEGIRFGVFGDLGGKFRVFWGMYGGGMVGV